MNKYLNSILNDEIISIDSDEKWMNIIHYEQFGYFFFYRKIVKYISLSFLRLDLTNLISRLLFSSEFIRLKIT